MFIIQFNPRRSINNTSLNCFCASVVFHSFRSCRCGHGLLLSCFISMCRWSSTESRLFPLNRMQCIHCCSAELARTVISVTALFSNLSTLFSLAAAAFLKHPECVYFHVVQSRLILFAQISRCNPPNRLSLYTQLIVYLFKVFMSNKYHRENTHQHTPI